MSRVEIAPKIIALIQKYIGSSLKSVEACIGQYPEAKKYQPLMKTRGELKQILKALKGKSDGISVKCVTEHVREDGLKVREVKEIL